MCSVLSLTLSLTLCPILNASHVFLFCYLKKLLWNSRIISDIILHCLKRVFVKVEIAYFPGGCAIYL